VLSAVAAALLTLSPTGPVLAKDKGCPPGLAKKSPSCVPPGLAKKSGHDDGDTKVIIVERDGYRDRDHDHDRDGVRRVYRDWRFDDDRRDVVYYGADVYRTGDRLPDGSYVVIKGDELLVYPRLRDGRRYVQLDNDVVAVVDAAGSFIRAMRALSALGN
jgi:hypothetical protein